MEVKEIILFKDSLKNFGECLLDGRIKEAKIAVTFSFKTFRELKGIIPAIIHTLEENSANQLTFMWSTFQTSFADFEMLVNKELNINEQTFFENPETWKELLSSIFKEKIDTLYSLSDRILSLLKTPAKPEQKLLPFKYLPEYVKLKEKHKLYAQCRNAIERVEGKILRYATKSVMAYGRIVETRGMSGVIKTGVYKGTFHADLPKPMQDHRTVYSYGGNKVIFIIIGTHGELGIA